MSDTTQENSSAASNCSAAMDGEGFRCLAERLSRLIKNAKSNESLVMFMKLTISDAKLIETALSSLAGTTPKQAVQRTPILDVDKKRLKKLLKRYTKAHTELRVSRKILERFLKT